MAISITKPLTGWANAGTDPGAAKKAAGWLAEEKPPANWFNWLFHVDYEAIEELQQQLTAHGTDGEHTKVKALSTTDATSATDTNASFHTPGGMAVEKRIRAGGSIFTDTSFNNRLIPANGAVLVTQRNINFLYTQANVGDIPVGDAIRIRLRITARRVYALTLSFVGGPDEGTENNLFCYHRATISFFRTGANTLGAPVTIVDSASHNMAAINPVTFAAVGANDDYDLIITPDPQDTLDIWSMKFDTHTSGTLVVADVTASIV